MYLPWNAVTHKVPDGVSAELAGLVTPLSNGIEWALNAGRVGYATTVLIQGPGQQGLSQVVASKQAGASRCEWPTGFAPYLQTEQPTRRAWRTSHAIQESRLGRRG